tara:strand:- start:4909 stop:5214 length:306 start_codon:yes stop_codon:yes gene_type:complete
VKDQIQHTTEAKLQESAGSEYSFIKKLQIGGTGSMKMIHLDGLDSIDTFEVNSKSQHYLSFELIASAEKDNSPLAYFAALYKKVTVKVKEGIADNYFSPDL